MLGSSASSGTGCVEVEGINNRVWGHLQRPLEEGGLWLCLKPGEDWKAERRGIAVGEFVPTELERS